MQPNLPQDAKFSPANRDAIMRRYLSISALRGDGPDEILDTSTHLIWPESAFPFLLHRDAGALAQIAALAAARALLITGAARMDEPLPGESVGKFFNAIQVIDDRRHDPRNPTTRSIWCRSANTCRISRRGSSARVGLAPVRQHPGRLRAERERTPLCRCRACRRWQRRSATRRSFPDDVLPDGPAAGSHPQRHQRRLVRRHARALPAFRPGPSARRRGGACRWCAPPIRESRRSSIRTAVSSRPCRSARRAFSTPACRVQLSRTVYGQSRRFVLTAMLVICLMAAALRRRRSLSQITRPTTVVRLGQEV